MHEVPSITMVQISVMIRRRGQC